AKRTQRRAPELEGGGLLSIETAARRLGVAAGTLRNWIRGGQLPHVRLGRPTLIRPARLLGLLDAHEATGARQDGPSRHRRGAAPGRTDAASRSEQWQVYQGGVGRATRRPTRALAHI